MITQLKNYIDDKNNKIIIGNNLQNGGTIDVRFQGKYAHDNTLIIDEESTFTFLRILFLGSDSCIKIGKVKDASFNMHCGYANLIEIGDNAACSGVVTIHTAENTKVIIGKDCLFAANVYIKTHDHHPIFEVDTGKRVNESKDVLIEDHVWIAEHAFVSKGSHIGCGSVIGYGSFVNGEIPNNCVAAGVPAKIIKRDIAWERHGLNFFPFMKPDATMIDKHIEYWNKTENN